MHYERCLMNGTSVVSMVRRRSRMLLVSHADRDGSLRINSARTLTRKEKKSMNKRAKNTIDVLRPEYDMTALLKGGIKGKYAERFEAGTNLVLIEPEIHSEFKTDKEVNDALRLVIEMRKIVEE